MPGPAPVRSPTIDKAVPPAPHPEKQVEMTLTYVSLTGLYKVEAITNSSHYRPGYLLTHDVVTNAHTWPNWKISASEFHWLEKVIDILKPKIGL